MKRFMLNPAGLFCQPLLFRKATPFCVKESPFYECWFPACFQPCVLPLANRLKPSPRATRRYRATGCMSSKPSGLGNLAGRRFGFHRHRGDLINSNPPDFFQGGIVFCKNGAIQNARQCDSPPENCATCSAGHHILKKAPFGTTILVSDKTTRWYASIQQMRTGVIVRLTIHMEPGWQTNGSVVV